MARKKLVLFGAGKIGRSFIGQLFSSGGYEVVFIDVFKPVIDELNLRRGYNIFIKGEVESVIHIQNVRGVFANDEEKVIEEISTAEILGISVGLNGIKSTIPLIANGLIKRFKIYSALPLDIIIAENIRNAATFMRNELLKYLPEDYPIQDRVGLIETSIGKMVPIMLTRDMEADILQVFAEPYNTLILDKQAFKNQIPKIEGLAPKENMKAWVDRKLFIHNLGHSAAAYLGYLYSPTSTYLYEVLADKMLRKTVRDTMLQAADILLKKYPEEFTIESLTDHIDDLLKRFQNKALGDTLFRVGCDLQRKLGAEDRLAGAIHLARELRLPYDLILNTLVCALHFRATDEFGKMLPSDQEFITTYKNGIEDMLTNVCKFNKTTDAELINDIITLENSLITNQL